MGLRGPADGAWLPGSRARRLIAPAMNSLFAQLTLADVNQDVVRNIVSLRQSQDLFDDLTDDPAEWLLAQKVEAEVKPPPYRSTMPVVDRPFEDAAWFNAINWPFKNWQDSRSPMASLVSGTDQSRSRPRYLRLLTTGIAACWETLGLTVRW